VEDRHDGRIFPVWYRCRMPHPDTIWRHIWTQTCLQARSFHASCVLNRDMFSHYQKLRPPLFPSDFLRHECDSSLLRRLFFQHRDAAKNAPASREYNIIPLRVLCHAICLPILHVDVEQLGLFADSKHWTDNLGHHIPLQYA